MVLGIKAPNKAIEDGAAIPCGFCKFEVISCALIFSKAAAVTRRPLNGSVSL